MYVNDEHGSSFAIVNWHSIIGSENLVFDGGPGPRRKA
jgi:hypothetical protein